MDVFGVINILSGIIDKIIPNKTKAAEAKAELAKINLEGEFELLKKQLEINAEEAKNSRLFVSGWRPACGWMCVVALGYHTLLLPLILFICTVCGVSITLPEFDVSSLMTILGGILGLGGFRSIEKINKVAKK